MEKCFLIIGEDGKTIYRVSDGVCKQIPDTDPEYPSLKKQLDDACADARAKLQAPEQDLPIMFGIPCK